MDSSSCYYHLLLTCFRITLLTLLNKNFLKYFGKFKTKALPDEERFVHQTYEIMQVIIQHMTHSLRSDFNEWTIFAAAYVSPTKRLRTVQSNMHT